MVPVYLVHASRTQIQEEKRDRILSLHERSVITFAYRACNQAALNGAPIHKDQLLGARLAAKTDPHGMPIALRDQDFAG